MEVTKEFIERNWPLTEAMIEQMPKQGMAGHVGIVNAKEGKYTYKIAGHWKTAENLNRDLSAYEFLNQKNFPYISRLLNAKENKRFIQVDDKLIYLIEYIEGTHPTSNPETYSELGTIAAELHSIQGFPFESHYRPVAAIPQQIERISQGNFIFKEDFIQVINSIKPFDEQGLTMVPIHTEITPGNVIQKPDGSIVAIDWDEVGIGPAVLDLGVGLINHMVTEDLEIKEDWGKAYYSAYFALRPMTDNEKEYIWEAALYWACLWVTYGNPEKRWKRILWAIENKDKITALYTGGSDEN
jgi:Ser/Thr protein kinase RdoA (MazF antagonist)